MAFKYLAGLIAVALLATYLLAPVLKLKEIDLGVVVVIGLTMTLVDLWQSLRSRDD